MRTCAAHQAAESLSRAQLRAKALRLQLSGAVVMVSSAPSSYADALRRTEDGCRALSDACVRATDRVLATHSLHLHDATRFVLDACHVAGATARVLSRHADYQPHVLVMIVEACRQIALQCGCSCEATRDVVSLIECERACEVTVASCGELLELLGPLDRMQATR
jgi:hypothetical protein